jgi:hypothetical protein
MSRRVEGQLHRIVPLLRGTPTMPRAHTIPMGIDSSGIVKKLEDQAAGTVTSQLAIVWTSDWLVEGGSELQHKYEVR